MAPRSIIPVPKVALFWTWISDVDPGIGWIHSPSLGVTVLNAHITIGSTDAFSPLVHY